MTSCGQRGSRIPAMSTLASRAVRSLRCAIPVAVGGLAGSLHRLNDLLLGGLRTASLTSRAGGAPTKVLLSLVRPQALQGVEVLHADQCDERLALLLHDDGLTGVAHPVGQLSEARPCLTSRYASGHVKPPHLVVP